ncbi:hypothetical protein RhiirA4_488734 [Rhizophagus irregularis]|uniref:Uncharacterized protein n=1 Tax=Rhizophagus irregularis TaxID=588596 RepID=A0A2I1HTZ9_9GLOM|nr:hypothetical protein RhiirA4_488734 [Rhizophagus irregularis]
MGFDSPPYSVILGGMVATIRGDPGDSLRLPVLVITVCVGSPSQLPLGKGSRWLPNITKLQDMPYEPR